MMFITPSPCPKKELRIISPEDMKIWFLSMLYVGCELTAGRDGLRPTGRNVMGHATTYRILLRKAGKSRVAVMVDSPYHMYDQTRFAITEAGVQDVEEHKNQRELLKLNGCFYGKKNLTDYYDLFDWRERVKF
jgi:hypothetical protein